MSSDAHVPESLVGAGHVAFVHVAFRMLDLGHIRKMRAGSVVFHSQGGVHHRAKLVRVMR
jgi:hypothetical protein